MRSYRYFVLAVLAAFTTWPTMAQAAGDNSFAVIDLDILINDSDAGKSLQSQLNAKREQFQKEFSKREEELSAKEKQIVEKKATMSAEELGKQRQAFEADLLETRKLFQQRRNALDKALATAMKDIRSEIIKASAEIAEEKGYKAIFLRESVVIVEKDLDITQDVLKKLNATVKSIPVKVE